jgi:RluA family pseudouridine synthase
VTSPISVIYHDAGLVVVNKPPGLPVVPAAGARPIESVRGQLEDQLGVRLWVVHRLDRDASGALLFARSADVHREMCVAFEDRRVRKAYLAFTADVPSPREGRVDVALHQARRGKTRPALPGEPGARDAATRYVVRKRWTQDWDRVAMVEAHPETGRHHQIRVHLRSIGTPILFDHVYGRQTDIGALEAAPAQRLALHAARLTVPDASVPEGERLFEAPLPADLVALLHWLDGEWTPEASGP